MPKSRSGSKSVPLREALAELDDLHEWMQQHSPAEFAAEVELMTPEERVRVRAHISVLKDWLKEFVDNLPSTARG